MKATHNILSWILVVVGLIFLLTGCVGLYEQMGFTTEESENLAGLDRTEFLKIKQQADSVFWQTASVVIAGVGALVSGFLGKWLYNDKQMIKAIVSGVEASGSEDVKNAIQNNAKAMGVESNLRKRVNALT